MIREPHHTYCSFDSTSKQHKKCWSHLKFLQLDFSHGKMRDMDQWPLNHLPVLELSFYYSENEKRDMRPMLSFTDAVKKMTLHHHIISHYNILTWQYFNHVPWIVLILLLSQSSCIKCQLWECFQLIFINIEGRLCTPAR